VVTMTDVVEQRRALVDFLDRHPLVDDVDFTRDGFETVILSLGGQAENWSTPELSVTFDERRLTFFKSESGQWYRQEWERTPDRVSEDWRPVGVEAIDEPTVEVHHAE